MEVTVRRADASDEKAFLGLLERHVTRNAQQRYRWIYRDNPQGPATTWLATEGDQILGFTSIFARQFVVDGRDVQGGVGFDAFVLPQQRRRGIARRLHAASREAMALGDAPYRFMCGPPVLANLHALVQAGAHVWGTMRYAGLPLTTRGVATMMHFGNETLLRAVDRARVLDAILKGGRALVRRVPERAEVKIVHRAGPEFDSLWRALQPSFRVVGRRDATYLNWRYVDNPVCHQRLVAVELRGKLLGWAVLELAGKGCLLADYLLPLDRAEADIALAAIVEHAARAGACRVTLRLEPNAPHAATFRRHGFLFGWSKEPVQVLCDDRALLPTLMTPSAWHLCNGDLNPEASPWSVDTTPAEAYPVVFEKRSRLMRI